VLIIVIVCLVNIIRWKQFTSGGMAFLVNYFHFCHTYLYNNNIRNSRRHTRLHANSHWNCRSGSCNQQAIYSIEDIGRCISVITKEPLETVLSFQAYFSCNTARYCGLLHENVWWWLEAIPTILTVLNISAWKKIIIIQDHKSGSWSKLPPKSAGNHFVLVPRSNLPS